MSPAAAALQWAGAAVVAAVVLGPALRPGFLMRVDLVTVPDPVFTTDTLGLGDRLPRSVPWDAAMATAAMVLPDRWLGQLAALVALTLAGAGAARLSGVGAGAWLALLVAIWNPFVMEQLAVGHVPHLLAYGALPWLVMAAWSVVRNQHGWPVLALAVVVGSLTPGGGLLVVATTVAVVAAALRTGPTDRATGAGAVAVALAAAAQAPWVLAGLTHPARGSGASPAGFEVFAVRAETWLGPIVDLFGLGGMWAQAALPASRSTPLAVASTVLLLSLAAIGARPMWRLGTPARPVAAALAVLAGVGYLIAALPHLPGGSRLVSLVAGLPAAGLLRDGHRWLAWPAILIAVLSAHAVAALAAILSRAASRGRRSPTAGVAALVLLAGAVVAVAPDLAGGLSGRLVAREFPADWLRARAVLDRARDSDALLSLPWQPFRRFAWSGPLAVLDPAPRAMPRPALVDDALSVDGRRLPGEGPAATLLRTDLADGRLTPAELSRLGVGWVLIEHGTPGTIPEIVGPADVVYRGPDLSLIRLMEPTTPATVIARPRYLSVILGHLTVAAILLAGAVGAGATRVRGRRLLVNTPSATFRPGAVTGAHW